MTHEQAGNFRFMRLCGVLALAGCQGLLGPVPEAERAYLPASPRLPAAAVPTHPGLSLSAPWVRGPLREDRIWLRQPDGEWVHLAGARWAYPPAEQLARWTLDGLSSSGRFARVILADLALEPWLLGGELIAFELSAETPRRAHIEVHWLLRCRDGAARADRRIAVGQTLAGQDGAAIQAAFAAAATELLDRTQAWLTELPPALCSPTPEPHP